MRFVPVFEVVEMESKERPGVVDIQRVEFSAAAVALMNWSGETDFEVECAGLARNLQRMSRGGV